MEQDRDFEPRWFERDEWDGQDASLPDTPYEPDEIDRLLYPELYGEGSAAPRLPACTEPASPPGPAPAPTPQPRPRRDGFTPERQERFIELIRGGASGREAARGIGISPTTAYNLYNSPEGAHFKAAWDEAAKVTDVVLEDTAYDRAVNGQEEVVYHQGRRVGVRWRYDNKLLMQLLRARNPLKYAPLSELEGWLRHRGIAPPPEIDAALHRLRAAEAGPHAQIASSPGGAGAGEHASTSSTSSSPALAGEGDRPQGGGGAAAQPPVAGADPSSHASTSSTSQEAPLPLREEGCGAAKAGSGGASQAPHPAAQPWEGEGPAADPSPDASTSSTSPPPPPPDPPHVDSGLIPYRPPPKPRLRGG